MKIALLHPYFGSIPAWWDVYVKSCGMNPSIDFFYITDLDIPTFDLPNIKVIPMTYMELIEKASTILGFDIIFKNPYKFCDLRPSFGLIFSELLVGYDFWGHGDIDVIYGNISDWLTLEKLNSFDIISCRKLITAGQFTLYRNASFVNHLYQKIENFEECVNSDVSNYLDEGGQTKVVMAFVSRGELRFYGEDALVEDVLAEVRGRKSLFIRFSEGRVLDGVFGNSYLLFHFIQFKRIDRFVKSFSDLSNFSAFVLYKGKILNYRIFDYLLKKVMVLYEDKVYIFKRIVKKYLFRRESDCY